MFRKLLLAVFTVATLAVIFIYLKDPYSSSPSTTQRSADGESSNVVDAARLANGQTQSGDTLTSPGSTSNTDNPFATISDESTELAGDESASPVIANPNTATSTNSALLNETQVLGEPILAGIPLGELGIDRWTSTAEFDEIIAQIDANPELLGAVLEQFRQTTDAGQLTRLTQLLGRFDSARVADVASEIAVSGDTPNRLAALDLLRQVHASNPEAREVILDIIDTDIDTQVLSSALNAIASPTVVSTDHRQRILSGAADLSSHQDAIVRARSFSVLADWTDTDQLTPRILEGLNDPDPRVRQSVTYSLVDYNYTDGAVKRELIRVADNSAESVRTRRGALQALSRISLTDDERAQLRAINSTVNGTQ